MKIVFLFLYKTSEPWLQTGIEEYLGRLRKYLPVEVMKLPGLKNTKSLSIEQQKILEGEQILKPVSGSDFLVLLDENGKEFSSEGLSMFLQDRMNSGAKKIIIAIGGPYGFSDEVYKRSDFRLSFSRLTFSHQMIRLLLAEQLYRAMTILKNEPYHHT